jgi:hypothetical protein
VFLVAEVDLIDAVYTCAKHLLGLSLFQTEKLFLALLTTEVKFCHGQHCLLMFVNVVS